MKYLYSIGFAILTTIIIQNQAIAQERLYKFGSSEWMVLDRATSLIWQGIPESGKTWQQALSYCEGKTYGGSNGWRLPNTNELLSLINYDKWGPATDFPQIPADAGFWTSTTFLGSTDHALVVSFVSGLTGKILKSEENILAICVRNFSK